jgi:hypothetical protein
MKSNIFLSLLMHLIVGNDVKPEYPKFVMTKVLCKEILYTSQREGYKYIGLSSEGKEYLTNYENSDSLDKEIDRQCRR